ncbi:unnamed protein product [Meganyctiphanes norvegica]|uniref:Uncharacterized protein n=1 Tax=Meganyctiphanes norvegica TaxID=48144 RepID=A0AAV2Q251_MEGNR
MFVIMAMHWDICYMESDYRLGCEGIGCELFNQKYMMVDENQSPDGIIKKVVKVHLKLLNEYPGIKFLWVPPWPVNFQAYSKWLSEQHGHHLSLAWKAKSTSFSIFLNHIGCNLSHHVPCVEFELPNVNLSLDGYNLNRLGAVKFFKALFNSTGKNIKIPGYLKNLKMEPAPSTSWQ